MGTSLNRTGVGKKNSRKGYILLEVILAAGIFAIAGIGLAKALNNMASVFTNVRRDSEIRVQLESRLALARMRPLISMHEKSKPDRTGVVYEKEVALLDLANDDKVLLNKLYRVTVEATWKEGKEEQREKAEVIIYQP